MIKLNDFFSKHGIDVPDKLKDITQKEYLSMSEADQLVAIRREARVFRFDNNATPEFIEKALEVNNAVINYIGGPRIKKMQEESIIKCAHAINDGFLFNSSSCNPDWSESTKLLLLAQDPWIISEISEQTDEHVRCVIEHGYDDLQFLNSDIEWHLISDEVIIEWLKIDASALRYLVNPRLEIRRVALGKDPERLIDIPNPTEEEFMLVAGKKPYAVLNHPECPDTDKILLACIQSNPACIKNIKKASRIVQEKALELAPDGAFNNGYYPFDWEKDLQEALIKNSPYAIRWRFKPSEELMDLAISIDPKVVSEFKRDWFL